jgi:hypothetical protein
MTKHYNSRSLVPIMRTLWSSYRGMLSPSFFYVFGRSKVSVVVFSQANSRPVVLSRRIEFTLMSNIKMNTLLQKYWPYVEGVCPLNLGNILICTVMTFSG